MYEYFVFMFMFISFIHIHLYLYTSSIYWFLKIVKNYMCLASMKINRNISRQLVWREMCRLYILLYEKYIKNKINNFSLKVLEFTFRIWTKIIHESEMAMKESFFFYDPNKRLLRKYEKLVWMYNSKLLRHKKSSFGLAIITWFPFSLLFPFTLARGFLLDNKTQKYDEKKRY